MLRLVIDLGSRASKSFEVHHFVLSRVLRNTPLGDNQAIFDYERIVLTLRNADFGRDDAHSELADDWSTIKGDHKEIRGNCIFHILTGKTARLQKLATKIRSKFRKKKEKKKVFPM